MNWEIVHGSFDKALFNTFIQTAVLPFCTPFPGPKSVIVMDNCKIHFSEVSTTNTHLFLSLLIALGALRYV